MYAATFDLSLGSGATALTLKAVIVGTDGLVVARNITAGFTELGVGLYQWYYASFADGQRGSVVFYTGTYAGSVGQAWSATGIVQKAVATLDAALESSGFDPSNELETGLTYDEAFSIGVAVGMGNVTVALDGTVSFYNRTGDVIATVRPSGGDGTRVQSTIP